MKRWLLLVGATLTLTIGSLMVLGAIVVWYWAIFSGTVKGDPALGFIGLTMLLGLIAIGFGILLTRLYLDEVNEQDRRRMRLSEEYEKGRRSGIREAAMIAENQLRTAPSPVSEKVVRAIDDAQYRDA